MISNITDIRYIIYKYIDPIARRTYQPGLVAVGNDNITPRQEIKEKPRLIPIRRGIFGESPNTVCISI